MALSTRSGQTAVDSTERHGAGDLRRRAAEADMSAGVVFVVDDDAAIRNSLCRLITSVGSTVEVFPSARAFLEARRPDAPGCLVLDVRLPGLSGLDLQRELAATDAELPIVFLTSRSPSARRSCWTPFEARSNAIARCERSVRSAPSSAGATPRSRRASGGALERIVAGLLNKQIAGELGTSEATVKEQRGHVMAKMLAGSVADLVRLASRLGITPAGQLRA
jgi:FixJ family two-component response regulator